MNCEDARDGLSALVRGHIGLTEWALLEAHVKQCAECRQAEAHLRRRAAASRQVTRPRAVLASLRKAMELARIGVSRFHRPGRASPRAPDGRRPRPRSACHRWPDAGDWPRRRPLRRPDGPDPRLAGDVPTRSPSVPSLARCRLSVSASLVPSRRSRACVHRWRSRSGPPWPRPTRSRSSASASLVPSSERSASGHRYKPWVSCWRWRSRCTRCRGPTDLSSSPVHRRLHVPGSRPRSSSLRRSNPRD